MATKARGGRASVRGNRRMTDAMRIAVSGCMPSCVAQSGVTSATRGNASCCRLTRGWRRSGRRSRAGRHPRPSLQVGCEEIPTVRATREHLRHRNGYSLRSSFLTPYNPPAHSTKRPRRELTATPLEPRCSDAQCSRVTIGSNSHFLLASGLISPGMDALFSSLLSGGGLTELLCAGAVVVALYAVYAVLLRCAAPAGRGPCASPAHSSPAERNRGARARQPQRRPPRGVPPARGPHTAGAASAVPAGGAPTTHLRALRPTLIALSAARSSLACRAHAVPAAPPPRPHPNRPSRGDLDSLPGPWRSALPLFGNILTLIRPDFHKVLLQWADEHGAPPPRGHAHAHVGMGLARAAQRSACAPAAAPRACAAPRRASGAGGALQPAGPRGRAAPLRTGRARRG